MGGFRSKQAEIFNPMMKRTCSVENLNQMRKSCEKFDGISSFTSLPLRLVKSRDRGLCWGLKSGDVLLLGGLYSEKTTERVSADGSSSKLDFKLPYRIQ